MLANISQINIPDSFQSFWQRQNVLAHRLLYPRPQKSIIVVHITSQFRSNVGFLRFQLHLVKPWFNNRYSLELHNPLPLKICTFRFVTHRYVRRPSIMICSIFRKFRFKSLLVFILSVRTKSQVLYDVRYFVYVLIMRINHSRPKLHSCRHYTCPRHIH